ANRFVEMTVSNRPPIAPRQQILSVPFALRADRAATVESNGVNTAALTDGSVTLQKLAPLELGTNVGVGGLASSSNSTQTIGSTAYVDIPDLVLTLQTTGRPVEVFLGTGTVPGYSSLIATYVSSGPRSDGAIRLLRNGTPTQELALGAASAT